MDKAHPLDALLDHERGAILSGDFDRLADLSEDKARLIADLPQDRLSSEQLNRISSRLERNQMLLAAAIDGVRTVASRLETMRHARDGFEAYDKTGQRSRVGSPKGGFERKA